jgi:hypothetical protein
MNDQLQQLATWGYRVEVAQTTADVDVYFVDGFGLAVYVREDDADTLAALTNPDAQAERVQQQGETFEQTQARWVRAGRIPAPYPPDV